MQSAEDLFQQMRLQGGRHVQQISRTRMGKVTSYDPDRYAVKVKLLPEGNESGWIPLSAGHVGSGFGAFIAPNIGEQIEVAYQEGDGETGRVVGRIPSNKDHKPPRVEAGEFLYKHKDGATFKLDKDGNAILTQGGGTLKITKAGKLILNFPAGIEATGPITHTGDYAQTGVHTDSNGIHGGGGGSSA